LKLLEKEKLMGCVIGQRPSYAYPIQKEKIQKPAKIGNLKPQKNAKPIILILTE